MEPKQSLSVEKLLMVARYNSAEGARKRAGLEVVAAEENKHLLEDIAEDEQFSAEVRERAGKKVVEQYIHEGDYIQVLWMGKPRRFTTRVRLPEAVQAYAQANLEKTVEDRIEDSIKSEDNGRSFFSRGTLSDIYHNEELSQAVRRKAVEKTIALCTAYKNYDRLKGLAANKKYIPEDLREKAGFALVELQVQEGNGSGLYELAKERKIPKLVRKAAKERVGEAATKAIDQIVTSDRGNYAALHHIANNKKYPQEVRRRAYEAIGEAAENDRNRLVREQQYSNLFFMARIPYLPDNVRERAAASFQEVINHILESEPGDHKRELKYIAQDANHLPGAYRTKAREKLRQYAQDLADRLE